MLITAGILLGIISTIIEISLVSHSPWLLNLMLKTRKFPLPMAFSILLSIFLGIAFGAAGLTTMIAGGLSTLLSQPYYWWKRPETQAARQQKVAPVQRMFKQQVRIAQTISAPARSVSYMRRTWTKK